MFRLRFSLGLGASALALSCFVAPSAFAQTTFSSSGGGAAAIQASVDSFRAAIGGVNNGVGNPQASGRREINWDAVPAGFSSPNALPGNFFNVNSPRGAVFSTPGSGFQVSAASGGATPVNFGNIDPSYATTFSTFSPQKLFTSIGSNITDVTFFVPGTISAATVSAFGSVFSDVDLANSTTMQFFSAANVSLGTFGVQTASGGLSFLGVQFAAPSVARVRITSGNASLGAGVLDGGATDLVVMDDFVYAEPVSSAAAPEPTSVVLLGFGLAFGVVLKAKAQK